MNSTAITMKSLYFRYTSSQQLDFKAMTDPVLEGNEGVSRTMEDGVNVDPVKKEVVGGKKMDEEGGVPLTSQCSVCTAPASEHRHYGAVSCYSCRCIHLTPTLRPRNLRP